MRKKRIIAKKTSTICTKKCWDAVGYKCHCSCGGANHGVGAANIRLVDSVPVAVRPQPTKPAPTLIKVTKKTPIMCCGKVRSFRFSDGKIISMCPVHSGRTNHFYPEFNSTRGMDVQRRAVLCGGTR